MKGSDPLTDVEIADFVESLRTSASSHSKTLEAIEDRLGIEPGFVRRLMEEPDDWAFIIKTCVVIESALGQVLSDSMFGDALGRHVRALPMDGRIGKIKLAQDLNIIGPKSTARLKAICEVRNDFAHGLKILKLSIAEYFSQMTEQEFESLADKFFSLDGSTTRNKPTDRTRRSARVQGGGHPDGRIGKYLFWSSACITLLQLSEQQRQIDADRSWRNALMTLGHAFLARQKGDEGCARLHMREALETLETAANNWG
jgi:hypothetical protein